jgi:hypothetical protein
LKYKGAAARSHAGPLEPQASTCCRPGLGRAEATPLGFVSDTRPYRFMLFTRPWQPSSRYGVIDNVCDQPPTSARLQPGGWRR